MTFECLEVYILFIAVNMSDIPRLITSILTPKIIWYQTDVSVILRIMLPNIKDYYLSISVDHFLFTAVVDGKDYFAFVKFFGAVDPAKTKHINLDREVRIYIVKGHKWMSWLRLQKEEERNPLIVYDPDHVDIDTDWKKSMSSGMGIGLGGRGVSFEEYKRMNGITNIMPEGSTDEEESDDDKMDSMFDCHL